MRILCASKEKDKIQNRQFNTLSLKRPKDIHQFLGRFKFWHRWMPLENGYNKSLNGRLRDELLNGETF